MMCSLSGSAGETDAAERQIEGSLDVVAIGEGGRGRLREGDAEEEHRVERDSVAGLDTSTDVADGQGTDVGGALSEVRGVDGRRDGVGLGKADSAHLSRAVLADPVEDGSVSAAETVTVPGVDKRRADGGIGSHLVSRHKPDADGIDLDLVEHAGEGVVLRVLSKELEHPHGDRDVGRRTRDSGRRGRPVPDHEPGLVSHRVGCRERGSG